MKLFLDMKHHHNYDVDVAVIYKTTFPVIKHHHKQEVDISEINKILFLVIKHHHKYDVHVSAINKILFHVIKHHHKVFCLQVVKINLLLLIYFIRIVFNYFTPIPIMYCTSVFYAILRN